MTSQQKKAACTTLLFGSTSGLNLLKYLIFCSFKGSSHYSCLNPHFCIFFEPFFVRFELTLSRKIFPSNLLIYKEKPPYSAVFSMCIYFEYTLWSERHDLNVRPLPPQGSALAKLSYAPKHFSYYITANGICQAFLAVFCKKSNGKIKPDYKKPKNFQKTLATGAHIC